MIVSSKPNRNERAGKDLPAMWVQVPDVINENGKCNNKGKGNASA
jgi:hypothetical protein